VSEKSDNELIGELQNGNSRALHEIIDRWETRLKAFIYRFTQDFSWTDELTQETFVKVYQNAGKFDPNKAFSPWIYTIALNICRNLHRWRKRRPQFNRSLDDTDCPFVHPDPDSISPAESAQEEEQSLAIRAAIRDLPEGFQVALILHYYQGMSYEEVADVLKCSVRGVETKLYRARKLLKKKLSLLPV